MTLGASEGASATDTTPRSREANFPVQVSLLYPGGTGLQTGGVALRNRSKISYDHYRIKKRDVPTLADGRLLVEVVQTLLRLAPSRPVYFHLRCGSAREYTSVRKVLTEAMHEAGVHWSFGGGNEDVEMLKLVATFASEQLEWPDINNSVHSYVSSVSNGHSSFVALLNATPRSLVWRELNSEGGDPVAASFDILRNGMAGLPNQTRMAIWTASPVINAILRSEDAVLTPAAKLGATNLSNYRKAQGMTLCYNTLASRHLITLVALMCARQFKRYAEESASQPAPLQPVEPARRQRRSA